MPMAHARHVAALSMPAGRVVRHALEVTALADGSRIMLPLLLINGACPGPRLSLGAAIHGDDVSGVAILLQACAQVPLDMLAGSIICVLVQYPLALQAEHRVPVGLYLKAPLDQMPIDPWTSVPGHAEGNSTERLAATLVHLMTTCDSAIDVPTPTRGGRSGPMTIFPHPALGASLHRAAELGRACGSGSILQTRAGMDGNDGMLCVEAPRAGVPACTCEIGAGGRLDVELIPVGVQCICKARRFLPMLPGAPQPPRATVTMTRFVGVRAKRGGLLHTVVQLGAYVRQGEVLER